MNTLKTRIVNTSGTEDQWEKVGNVFIPEPGEVIIYLPDTSHTYSRMKVGDGQTLLNQLPFRISLNDFQDTNADFILDSGVISSNTNQ